MIEGAVIRADGIVKIHTDIITTGRDEYHDLNEPGGGAGGTLGHAEPFIESVGRPEGSQGDSIRVDC